MLLCYDGSETARRAIERAGQLLDGGPVVVLTVWESLGSAILRSLPSDKTEIGRDARGNAEDVVEELDASTADAARATASEGAALAAGAGFDARPLSRRALARAAERTAVSVWRAVLDVADEEDTELIVRGSRGRSRASSRWCSAASRTASSTTPNDPSSSSPRPRRASAHRRANLRRPYIGRHEAQLHVGWSRKSSELVVGGGGGPMAAL